MRKAGLANVVALVVGGLLTLLWLGACARYVEGVIGWERLQSAPPHELALLIAGAATPLAFVWLLLLYLVRGFTISETTGALLARLEAMTYPAEGMSSVRIRLISIEAAFRPSIMCVAERRKPSRRRSASLSCSARAWASAVREASIRLVAWSRKAWPYRSMRR